MSRFARFLILLTVLSVLVVAISAVTAQDTVTLKLWSAVKAEGANQHMIDAFEAQHPDIQVEFEEFPWSDADWALRLATAAAAGNLPDVIEAPQVGISWYIQGFLQPVNDLVERDNMDMNYWSQAWLDLSIFNGDIIGLPFEGSAMLLFYNADLLNEAGIDPPVAPESWSALMDYAGQARQARR